MARNSINRSRYCEIRNETRIEGAGNGVGGERRKGTTSVMKSLHAYHSQLLHNWRQTLAH